MPRKSGSQEEFPPTRVTPAVAPSGAVVPSVDQPVRSAITSMFYSDWLSGRDIKRQRRELDARQRSIESEASAR